MKEWIIILILVGALVAGCGADGPKAVVYKSPTCGCCVGYAKALTEAGFDVEFKEQTNLQPIKAQYQISSDMQSCHTTIIEGYFIEGHVPIEAVQRMLDEKPAIDGIALPGMPSGTPGMPGMKRGQYVVSKITNGVAEEYMRI